MECKYYKPINTDTLVSWKYVDKYGKKINGENRVACFSTITYGGIGEDVDKIIVSEPLNKIPYDVKFIKEWIELLNEIGFPCKVSNVDKTDIEFEVDIKDYKYKIHLNVTLQFIRTLYESGICYVPERYFALLEENPKTDKFLLLQDAHKTVDKYTSYYNTNHMATCTHNGKNITYEQFLQRIEKSGTKVSRKMEFGSIHTLFHG